MSTNTTPIAFIGGGNMARALIGGLLARGFPAAAIHVAEPVAAVREALATDFRVSVHATASAAAADRPTWVLAVKPQVMREVCAALAERAQWQRPLVVSIAAGISSAQLERWLGGDVAVVRAMPNTPALLGAGITGVFANTVVTPAQLAAAEALLASAGPSVRITEEALMDAVTAVSGSGPAYVFLLAEAMTAAGIAQGLAPDVAAQLARQTILGAGRMLAESDVDAAELRRRVTSPGGTTQAAIESMQADGFEALIARAIAEATRRGRELSAANDKDAP